MVVAGYLHAGKERRKGGAEICADNPAHGQSMVRAAQGQRPENRAKSDVGRLEVLKSPLSQGNKISPLPNAKGAKTSLLLPTLFPTPQTNIHNKQKFKDNNWGIKTGAEASTHI